jgi:hypothetical protein
MKKNVFLFFLIFTGALCAQNADSTIADRIFGCSCCADTLHHYKKKNMIYVLTNNKTLLTAYELNKKRWSIKTADLVAGSTNARISCMEFYGTPKTVLRIWLHKKAGHIDLDPETGKRKPNVTK